MIQTTDDIVIALADGRDEIVSRMLRGLIKDHRDGGERRRYVDLWNRYRLKNVPIQHRKPANYEKVDRRVAHDFYADIVDTKTGYMGNAVSVSVQASRLTPEQADAVQDVVHDFNLRANSEDLNSEMVRDAAAVGVGYRLLYVPSGKNEIRMKNPAQPAALTC